MSQSIALIVNALGWTLLHSLWQGAIIGLLFVLSRSVLTTASPAIRHTNALVWLILFVVLPLFTFVGLILAGPGSGGINAVPSILPAMQITPWSAGSAILIPEALSIIGCLWLSGVIVLSIRLLGQWRELEHYTCLGAQPLPQLEHQFAVLKKAMNVRLKVELIEAMNATVPMVVGFLKPMIVLPSSALLGLTPRELEMIIAHELAHLQRKDHLINYFLISAETLLFFHPVVYTLTRTLRHERELCCDDLVINTFNERVCYAHALSKLEALRGMDVLPASNLRLAAADGPLVTRISRMVKRRTHKRWGVMPAAMLPFVAATFAIAVFHQTHVTTGQSAGKKSSKVTMNRDSNSDLSLVSGSIATGSDEAELSRVQLPDYARRTIEASTVSRITSALTRSVAPQPLTAIEQGAKLLVTYDRTKQQDQLKARSDISLSGIDAGSAPLIGSAGSNSYQAATWDEADQTSTVAEPDLTSSRLTNTYETEPDASTVPAANITDIEVSGLANSNDTGESSSAYIPSATNAILAPVTRNAGLPALPSYRPELSAAAAMTPTDDTVADLTGDDAVTESGGALVRSVTPRYPSRARSRGFVDKVVVSIQVDATGKVNGVSVVNRDSRPMFQRAVVRAVSQWEFEPLLRDGKPVERTVEQSFDFRLEPYSAKRRTQNCRDTRGDVCRLAT